MLQNCQATRMFLLLCAFSLCVECVSGGTSFLSPAQKPQGRGERRPPRTGRREASEPEIPVLMENDQFMVRAPFELALSLNEAEYEKYGSILQEVLVNLLSHSAPE